MFYFIIALFIGIPLIELMVLLEAGRVIGIGSTLLLIVITGVIGAALARQQGLKTLSEIQINLANGVMPGEKLVDGALILIAGAVLLTPGFITDALGFFVLWPFGRSIFKKIIVKHFKNQTTHHSNFRRIDHL